MMRKTLNTLHRNMQLSSVPLSFLVLHSIINTLYCHYYIYIYIYIYQHKIKSHVIRRYRPKFFSRYDGVFYNFIEVSCLPSDFCAFGIVSFSHVSSQQPFSFSPSSVYVCTARFPTADIGTAAAQQKNPGKSFLQCVGPAPLGIKKKMQLGWLSEFYDINTKCGAVRRKISCCECFMWLVLAEEETTHSLPCLPLEITATEA